MAFRINGDKVREKRKAKGLTQTELAKGNCTPAMVSLIESGKANPSERMVDMLAARLEVSAAELR